MLSLALRPVTTTPRASGDAAPRRCSRRVPAAPPRPQPRERLAPVRASAGTAGSERGPSRRIALASPLLLAAAASCASLAPAAAAVEGGTADLDLTITERVYFDFAMCSETIPASSRGLGDTRLCESVEPVGRIVIGLYGNLVGDTVRNFLTLVDAQKGGYAGTTVNSILPGEVRQGGIVWPGVQCIARDHQRLIASRVVLISPPRLGGVALPCPESRPCPPAYSALCLAVP